MNRCEHVRFKHGATQQCRRAPHTDALHVYSDPVRSGRVKPVSDKRRRETREYTRLRRAFLADHPRCTWPAGCVFPATEVHHRRGRIGALYLDTNHWSACCHDHHAWLTEHPAAAVEMGMSEKRVSA